MTTVGVTGSAWRATVTPWGAVVPGDGGPTLEWFVAAEDRWHVPAREPSVRQRRLSGAPVVETAVRVPGGDAVQRVYVVPGFTVVQVENRSSSAFAVAFSHGRLRVSRAPSAVPVQGIDLPPDAVVFPVPHTQTLVVALAHDGSTGPAPAGLPDAETVARGWVAQTGRGLRAVFPDAALGEAVVAARATVLLDAVGDPGDRVEFLLRAAEWCRMGEPSAPLVPVVADAAFRLARSTRRQRQVPAVVVRAMRAAADVLRSAGEDVAAGDVDRIADRLPAAPARPVVIDAGLLAGPPGVLLDEVRRLLVDDLGPELAVLPGFPAAWRGAPVEVHGMPTRHGTVSFAVRWHGERPALLWELEGRAGLRCPGLDARWRSEAAAGEALLAPVAAAGGSPGGGS